MRTSFTLYRALLSADVPEDKARDVVDALEEDMKDSLCTKQDLTAGLKDLELKITLRVVSIVLAGVGVNIGAMVGILKMMLPAAG